MVYMFGSPGCQSLLPQILRNCGIFFAITCFRTSIAKNARIICIATRTPLAGCSCYVTRDSGSITRDCIPPTANVYKLCPPDNRHWMYLRYSYRRDYGSTLRLERHLAAGIRD